MADFDSFVRRLKARGFDFEVLEEREIRDKCGRGRYHYVVEILDQVGFQGYLIFVFRDKETRSSWASEDYPGGVMINMACLLVAAELIKANQMAREKFRESIA